MRNFGPDLRNINVGDGEYGLLSLIARLGRPGKIPQFHTPTALREELTDGKYTLENQRLVRQRMELRA
jgi:hypothetical protein